MSQRSDALRDLVFVLLGVESDVVNRDGLTEALRTWDCGGPGSIVEILLAQGAIQPADFERLEKRVAEFLGHGPGALGGELPTVGAGGLGSIAETLPTSPGLAGTIPADSMTVSLPAASGLEPSTADPAPSNGTTRSQRFRVIEEHAKGGLGVVFRALDSELNREVALKQIQERHADNPSSRSRFLLEAEVTGGLEHPGIVPVYGLGLDGRGRPYYAMRFIRGDSLKDAIVAFHGDRSLETDSGRRSLELRKLLRRFLDVCNTIDYAHGRGVLHRDIKPANIMVGKYGETLVVDWGIAKVGGRPDLLPENDERSLFAKAHSGATETLPGSAMGTPAYMSPEQAVGDLDKLGPPSDVYSLGATLYCILAGRPPFEDADLVVVLRKVKEGDFPPPRKHDRSIPPALDAICMKAMALDPVARYASARLLADDIERWMADEPVTARRDPFVERARRWMRRRRTAVTAAAAAVLVAMMGLVVVLGVQQRANHSLWLAKEREHARFDLALEAIRTFHTGVSGDFLLRQDEFRDQRVKLLSTARDFYRKLERLLVDETDRASRQALGRSYFAVGELTSRIGTKDEALVSHARARAIRETLTAEPDTTDEDRAELAASLFAIASIDQEISRLGEAEGLLQRALAIRQDLVDRTPSSSEFRRDLAWCHHQLGDLLDKSGRPEPALEQYTLARQIRLDLTSRNPDDARLQFDLAASFNTIGRLHNRLGRPKEGMADLQRARDIRQQLVGKYPDETDFRDSLARTYHNIAVQLSRSGEIAESIDSFRQSLALRESLVASFPAVSTLQAELAAVASDLAARLFRVGQVSEALAAFERSRDIERRLHRSNPEVTRIERNLALSLISIGIILEEQGRPQAALASFEEARGHLQSLADRHPDVPDLRFQLAGVYAHLGRVFDASGRVDEALWACDLERNLLEALTRASPGEVEYRRELSVARATLGQVLADEGLVPQALHEFDLARREQTALATSDPNNTDFQEALASTFEKTALALARNHFEQPALTVMGQARTLRRLLVRNHPDDSQFLQGEADGLHALGEVLERCGRGGEAVDVLREALSATQHELDRNPGNHRLTYDLARIHKTMGDALGEIDRPAQAVTAYRLAIATLQALDELAAGDLELLAATHAALSELAGVQDSGLVASERPPQQDLAIATLRRAVEAGFRDQRQVDARPEYKNLRERPEFQDLLADLAFPINPFLPPRPVFPAPSP